MIHIEPTDKLNSFANKKSRALKADRRNPLADKVKKPRFLRHLHAGSMSFGNGKSFNRELNGGLAMEILNVKKTC